jgi:protein-export membrane protein SecD
VRRALLALTVVAACGSDKPTPPAGPGVTIVYTSDLAAVDPAARDRALREAVATIRRRIEEGGIDEPRVTAHGERIVVELPALDAERAADVRALISRTGALALKVVDSDAPVMRAIHQHIDRRRLVDPEIAALGIESWTDRWQGEGGADVLDHYLTAADREEVVPVERARVLGCLRQASPMEDGKVTCRVTGRQVLEGYLAELGQREPALRLPADRELGFERLPGAGGRPTWRSYLLERPVRIDGGDIVRAVRSRGPGGAPEVIVTLDADGKRRFAELTAATVGKKVAIVIDDVVHTAPIVQSPITGGRLTITIGGADPAAQVRDAEELARVLRAGSLPAPLIEESITQ